MGSWNETCGVTQLPIHYDDPVALILITHVANSQHENHAGHCRPNAVWSPRALPIFGRYNDYGGIEGWSEDWNTDFIIAGFREDLVENELHDLAVSKADLSIEKLLDLIHESRVLVHAPGITVADENGGTKTIDGRQPVGFMMVHRFAYDLLSSEQIEHGRGWEKHLTLNDAIEDGKVYYNLLLDRETADTGEDGAAQLRKRLYPLDLPRGNIFHFLDRGGDVLDHCNSRRGIWDYRYLLDACVAEGLPVTDPKVEDIIGQLARFYLFNAAFRALRKTYMPQAGKGSQDSNFELVEKLYAASAGYMAAKREGSGNIDDAACIASCRGGGPGRATDPPDPPGGAGPSGRPRRPPEAECQTGGPRGGGAHPRSEYRSVALHRRQEASPYRSVRWEPLR